MSLTNLFSKLMTTITLPPDHSCLDSGCNGSQMKGLSATCTKCLNPTFFQCMAGKKEIQLLYSMILSMDESNEGKKLGVLSELLSSESVFAFVCPKCLASKAGDLDAFHSAHQDEVKKLTARLDAQSKKLTKANKTNKELREQVKEFTDRANALNSSINAASIGDVHEGEEAFEDANNAGTNELSVIDATQGVSQPVVVNNNTSATTIDLRTENTVVVSNESQSSALLRPPPNKVQLPSAQSQPNSGRIFNIHLSKFVTTTETEHVVQHIMENSTLNASQFTVTALRRPGRRQSFLSFKISTASESVFNAILSPDLWLPNFSAKPFVQKNNRIQETTANVNATVKQSKNAPNTLGRQPLRQPQQQNSPSRRTQKQGKPVEGQQSSGGQNKPASGRARIPQRDQQRQHQNHSSQSIKKSSRSATVSNRSNDNKKKPGNGSNVSNSSPPNLTFQPSMTPIMPRGQQQPSLPAGNFWQQPPVYPFQPMGGFQPMMYPYWHMQHWRQPQPCMT